jgi:excisionase family DNA binding protein
MSTQNNRLAIELFRPEQYYEKSNVCLDYCRQTALLMPDSIVRVSVSEAARLFGVDTATIRRAIKNQEVRYVVVQKRYKITFESLVAWSQGKTTVKNKMNRRGIGQFVDTWKIKNVKYSPNPKSVEPAPDDDGVTPSPPPV